MYEWASNYSFGLLEVCENHIVEKAEVFTAIGSTCFQ